MHLNLLVFAFVVAAWVFACMRRRVAAVISALLAVGLISTIPASMGYYAAWLANPIIAVTWLLYLNDERPAALISASLALGLTLSFLHVEEVPLGPKENMVPIISYGIGYWLWVASTAIVVAGASTDVLLFRYVASGHR